MSDTETENIWNMFYIVDAFLYFVKVLLVKLGEH